MAAPEIVDIAPRGDVVFICDRENGLKYRIRVCSAIVSNASPVFNAMLGPHFREGNALARGELVEIPLPDDDPNFAFIMLNAMHLCRVSLPRELALGVLENLSLMVDKYDCAASLAPFAYYWTNELIHVVEAPELPRLLGISYHLHQLEAFESVVLKLVLESRRELSGNSINLVWCSETLGCIFDALEGERRATALKINNFLLEVIARNLHTGARACLHDCGVKDQVCGHFLRRLEKAHLLTLRLNTGDSDSSADEMLKRLLAMGFQSLEPRSIKPFAPVCAAYGALLVHGDEFAHKANSIRGEIRTFCLPCAKAGGAFKSNKCNHKATHDVFGG